MENLNAIKFEVPEQVVLDFIRSSYQFCKRCPIGPKGDKDECIKESLKLIHHFTYLKFHPYSDHRSGLNSIKDIKEVDFTEIVTDKETIIVTKKNQSIVPACEFRLKLRNKKWKISNVRINQGVKNYYTLFIN
jgi:hypothetical protein